METTIKVKIKREETIIIPSKIAIYEDKKTKVKSVAFPLNFPSGKNGMVTLTQLDNGAWQPSEDIESIVIKYK